MDSTLFNKNKMELIAKIRAEIDRQKFTIEGMFLKGDDSYYEGENDGYDRILSFLDTLQEPEKSQDTVGRVSVEIRSNLQTDEVVRKTLIMLVNDGRISVTGAITSSDILDWLEGQNEPEVDLEKEIERYFCDWKDSKLTGVALNRKRYALDLEETKDLARHFAEWQKNQMMKEAVEGTLGYGPHLQRPIIMLESVPDIWDGGCKQVRVIVLKED